MWSEYAASQCFLVKTHHVCLNLCDDMLYITIKTNKTYVRLQLKHGLFWYGHHPKMHEMVSDRSSRAENWTVLRKVSMPFFFNSRKCGKMIIWLNKTQQCSFSWNKNLSEATLTIPKLEKKKVRDNPFKCN